MRSAYNDASNYTACNTPIVNDGIWITNGTFLAYVNDTNVTLEDGTVIPVIATPAQARPYIGSIPHNRAMVWSGVGLNESKLIAQRYGWTTIEMAVTPEISYHPWAQYLEFNSYYKCFWEMMS
ncbi:hypothetical protein BFW01_g2800 [Lasiodiplodia theobromae]|nr:hypothetical protein BFW01_g2800 [Lasiodiplodia theobromae]